MGSTWVCVFQRLTTTNTVIAVSSAHRKEAFAATEYILEEVKQREQIFKREYYAGEDDETAQWKSNVS